MLKITETSSIDWKQAGFPKLLHLCNAKYETIEHGIDNLLNVDEVMIEFDGKTDVKTLLKILLFFKHIRSLTIVKEGSISDRYATGMNDALRQYSNLLHLRLCVRNLKHRIIPTELKLETLELRGVRQFSSDRIKEMAEMGIERLRLIDCTLDSNSLGAMKIHKLLDPVKFLTLHSHSLTDGEELLKFVRTMGVNAERLEMRMSDRYIRRKQFSSLTGLIQELCEKRFRLKIVNLAGNDLPPLICNELIENLGKTPDTEAIAGDAEPIQLDLSSSVVSSIYLERLVQPHGYYISNVENGHNSQSRVKIVNIINENIFSCQLPETFKENFIMQLIALAHDFAPAHKWFVLLGLVLVVFIVLIVVYSLS